MGMGKGMGANSRYGDRRARLATPAKASTAASAVQRGQAQWGKAAAAASIGGKAPPPSDVYEAQDPLLHPFHAEYRSKADAPATGAVAASTGISGEEDFYWLVAWAGVDHAFGSKGQGMPAELGPQGFLANARSDPSYRKTNPAAVGLRRMEQDEAGASFPPKPKPKLAATTPAAPEVPLAARVVQGHKYWPSEPVLVAVNRRFGHVRVAAAATSCAFWDRKSYGAVPAAAAAAAVGAPTKPDSNADSSVPKNIGSGGSVVGADGHGSLAPPPLHGSTPDPGLASVSEANAIGTTLAGGLSEQLTIAGSMDVGRDIPDESSIFIRMYVLLAILGSCMVVFWGAKRTFLSNAAHSAHAAAEPRDRSDWTRSANFAKA